MFWPEIAGGSRLENLTAHPPRIPRGILPAPASLIHLRYYNHKYMGARFTPAKKKELNPS